MREIVSARYFARSSGSFFGWRNIIDTGVQVKGGGPRWGGVGVCEFCNALQGRLRLRW
jgi:hypothetical protein